jgi:hypothetical protein
MRNIRARRHFRAILILLLTITISTFFENRIEAFAPELKTLAEGKIEDVFGRKLDISIGTLDGGIIHPFALRDVVILNKDGRASSQMVEINSIVSNYRIWDFIFSKLLSKTPYVSIDFSTRSKEITGFITLEGSVSTSVSIKGHIRLFEGERIEIRGSIKNGIARFILKPNAGIVNVEGNPAEGVLLTKINISHIKIYDFDIVGEILIKNIAMKNTISEEEDSLEGEIEARNLILNYKPFLDVKAFYRISRDFLEISDLDIGKLCRINGRFGLSEPYLVDATAVTDNINLGQMLSIFNGRYASFLSGTINSKWEFKGSARNTRSKIRLEIKKGIVGDTNFEYLNAMLKGDGPIIMIEDSRVMRESGYFILAGEIDMRKVGRDSLFENIKITEGEKAVLWDGWETAKWQDIREFRMRKKITEDFDVGLNKFINDEKVGENARDKDEFEFSYKLHPTDSLKIKFSDNRPFFGLEHKDRF